MDDTVGRFGKGVVLSIGIGAGLAGPVLAGPLFRRFFIIKIARVLRAGPLFRRVHYKNCACLLQLDHFKSPSYAPVL